MDTPSSPIETEFGVPIPGRILPESEWARTAIKRRRWLSLRSAMSSAAVSDRIARSASANTFGNA